MSRRISPRKPGSAWWRRACAFGTDTRLGPWLFTVARNLYYSYCRSRALGETVFDGLIGLWPGGSPRPSPFEETAARELERRVEHGLAALPAQSAKRCCSWESKG